MRNSGARLLERFRHERAATRRCARRPRGRRAGSGGSRSGTRVGAAGEHPAEAAPRAVAVLDGVVGDRREPGARRRLARGSAAARDTPSGKRPGSCRPRRPRRPPAPSSGAPSPCAGGRRRRRRPRRPRGPSARSSSSVRLRLASKANRAARSGAARFYGGSGPARQRLPVRIGCVLVLEAAGAVAGDRARPARGKHAEADQLGPELVAERDPGRGARLLLERDPLDGEARSRRRCRSRRRRRRLAALDSCARLRLLARGRRPGRALPAASARRSAHSASPLSASLGASDWAAARFSRKNTASIVPTLDVSPSHFA